MRTIALTGKHGAGLFAEVDGDSPVLAFECPWWALVRSDGELYAYTDVIYLPKKYRGYITMSGTQKQKFTMHELVLEEWGSPRPPGCVVNHRNFQTLDNQRSNLEWVTWAHSAMYQKKKLVLPPSKHQQLVTA